MPQIKLKGTTYAGNIYDNQPVGEVIQSASDKTPAGYLELLETRRSVLRIDYPDLFRKIGIKYGAEDDQHFNLPSKYEADIVSTTQLNEAVADKVTNTQLNEALVNYGKKDAIDANNVEESISNYGAGTLNSPYNLGIVDASDGLILSCFTEDKNWGAQLCLCSGNRKVFQRLKGGGNWYNWEEIARTNQEIVVGDIFNSGSDDVLGTGQAIVTFKGGLARVDFEIYITTDGVNNVFDVGLNRDILKGINNNIPFITPTVGTCTYMDVNGNVMPAEEGYGGTVRGVGQFWQFGRIYTTNGDVGGWPASQFKTGMRIKGTCYGTY